METLIDLEKEAREELTQLQALTLRAVNDGREGLITEGEARRRIYGLCDEAAAAIIALAREWGEYVIGEDEDGMTEGVLGSPVINVVARARNELRATQRKRNGE